jgi:hypothetical protein
MRHEKVIERNGLAIRIIAEPFFDYRKLGLPYYVSNYLFIKKKGDKDWKLIPDNTHVQEKGLLTVEGLPANRCRVLLIYVRLGEIFKANLELREILMGPNENMPVVA